MRNNYRIEPTGSHFIVIDPWGERLVDDYRTELAAKRDIERCQKEHAMRETAKLLVDIATKAHMQLHDVDLETARYWVATAAERR